jgi:pimeloyl-ACP methyl ester carboxylesterase
MNKHTLRAMLLAAGAAASWLALRRRPGPIPVTELTTPADRFVTIDDHSIRYRRQGHGPTIVLVHGFAGSLYTWHALIPLLAADYDVVACDLLGFGLSDKPARAAYSLADHGRRIVGLHQALDLHQTTLVGHSMGGVVATYAALNDPERRINRLALLGANFFQRNGPPLPMWPPVPQLGARQLYNPRSRAASLRRCYADPTHLTPEVLEAYLTPTRTPGALAALTAFLATPGPRTFADLPPRLRLPTLILWGAQDQLWPIDDGYRLQREIAGSRFEVIANAGHMLQEEQPDAVAEQLRGFIAGT